MVSGRVPPKQGGISVSLGKESRSGGIPPPDGANPRARTATPSGSRWRLRRARAQSRVGPTLTDPAPTVGSLRASAQRDLGPPLTVLVVNQVAGLPGSGFDDS